MERDHLKSRGIHTTVLSQGGTMRITKLALLAFAFLPQIASADISATVSATNNYIFRGVSQTSNGPAVQGSLDYSHSSGVAVGTFVSNAVNGTTSSEADVYASYTYKMMDDKLALTVSGTWYNNVIEQASAHGLNTFEYGLAVGIDPIKVEVGYTPNLAAKETTSTYVKLSGKHALVDNLSIIGNVGTTSFGDETKAGLKAFVDYRAGLSYAKDGVTTEFAYSDTDRKTAGDAGVEQADRAVQVIISKSF
jgi:uncharacterized protein (TIGR02001 family)